MQSFERRVASGRPDLAWARWDGAEVCETSRASPRHGRCYAAGMTRLITGSGVPLLVLLAGNPGCASGEGTAPLTRREAPPPSAIPTTTAPERRSAERAIDVAGVVATDLDDAIAGREVSLVDARGAQYRTVTNGDGGFSFTRIVPPYDLAVAAASSAAATVYLGLARRDPHVELFERNGPTPSLARQVLRVGVRSSACASGSCWLTVATASASGEGHATVHLERDAAVGWVDVDHHWHGASILPRELLDVHVLLRDGDEELASFAYARLPQQAAAPGETIDLGVAEVEPVPATDPVSVNAMAGAGALPDWRWTTTVSIDLSGDAISSFPLVVAEALSTTVRLPLIPQATMRAAISATHPRADAEAGFSRSAEAWSGSLPLSNGVSLDVTVGPDLVRPAASGSLSRRGAGFEWLAPPGGVLSTLTVTDISHGAARFRVFTMDPRAPLARLAQLGLSKLEVGNHVLDLSTSPHFGVEDAVSPDVVLRRRRENRALPGATTYLRVPFQVTP